MDVLVFFFYTCNSLNGGITLHVVLDLLRRYLLGINSVESMFLFTKRTKKDGGKA